MNIYIKNPKQPPKACVIWLHGLGANGRDMEGVANQLVLSYPIRHLFINAPIRPVTINQGMRMPAWYDIVGIKLTDREDREGIQDSETMILNAIETQIAEGMPPQHIFLAGFSQGGAMALFAGLRSKYPLGGLMVLSGYLPLRNDIQITLPTHTPLFIAAGLYDQVVLLDWTQQSVDWLTLNHFTHITWRTYPLGHFINLDEIKDLSHWFNEQLANLKSVGVQG